jgi:pimeloyl-ACP methyl ester carboxylesterase
MNTLVLLHGWGAGGGVWKAQTAYFQDRVAVMTPTIPVWEAGWLAAFLEGLPLERCLLVGWSLGGMLLLEAWGRLHRQVAGGLVLTGTAPVFCRRPDYPWGQPPGVVRAMRQALKKDPGRVLHDFADQCLAPGETGFAAQTREAFASPAAPATLAAGLDYLLGQDLRPILPQVPPGAVIIQGEADRIVPPAQARFLGDHLAGAKLFPLRGAGHLPFLTQAPVFNRILESCLNPMH